MCKISKEVYCEVTEQPFETCNVCGNSLQDQLYFVEKAYQKNKENGQFFVVFEFAICSNCRMDMLKGISNQSLTKMQMYMHDYTPEIENPEREIDFNTCTFTKEPLQNYDEYHMVATISKDKYYIPPVIMGGKIMEEYQELLSDKTKGFYDDFYNDFVDIPPALAKILKADKKPVFI
ncbi:hypothetical protein KRX57_09685 [Weeksellaceae bacterium TAE3-ERU29]|nr:hypothetical protein [Weeksellaceae bacterium TAE3-ERU29]